MDYKLQITKEASQKLRYYVHAVDVEISGMAKSVIDTENGTITMTDLIIFEQQCTGTTTKLDDKSMARFLMELMKKGDNPRDWNIWWHSHVDMACFWSSIDETTVQSHDSQEFLISLVVNKKGESKARLDIWQSEPNFGLNLSYSEELPVTILESDNLTLKAKIEKEVAEKVKEEVKIVYGGYQGGFRSSHHKGGWGNDNQKKLEKRGSLLINGVERNFDKEGFDSIGYNNKGFDREGNYCWQYDEEWDYKID